MGNISRKSDVGDYRYGAECQEGAGPHALCETGEDQRYWYDANGSMVGDSSGRRIEYSSFDKPTEIRKDGHSTRFAYNPSRARYLRSDEDREGATTLTRYLGNVERITHPDGRQEIKRRLPGGALISYTRSAGGQPAGKTTHYLHKDHLGSIDTISDETGQLVAQMSYDPWGQRRNALDWDALVAAELRDFDPDITGITKRGFTGHEMLDEVGLIHMNGRIYDPRLGRFMQADPLIDGVTDTQGYNRYSYVGNNPLAYTDPTGHFKLREFVGLIVGAAITWATGGLGAGAFASTWYGAATIGAAAGAAGAAANGGNIFQGALLGGISGAAFSGAGSLFEGSGQLAHLTGGAKLFSQTVVHGTVGGITSVLRGGKFGHGFATAGVAKFFSRSAQMLDMGSEGQFFAATISGGTASKITGGKFANGATTAALAYAVNQAASGGRNADNAQKGQSLEDYMQEKFGKLAITNEERGFAESGERKAFWTSRMERGDPIAEVALGIVNNESFVGYKYAGGRLANMFTGLEGEALNALGVDLMRAHIGAVDFDFNNKIGIPGLLSPTQAAAYHHEVFSTHGLGSWQFGGTLLNTSPNLMRAIWCTGCDHTGAAIR